MLKSMMSFGRVAEEYKDSIFAEHMNTLLKQLKKEEENFMKLCRESENLKKVGIYEINCVKYISSEEELRQREIMFEDRKEKSLLSKFNDIAFILYTIDNKSDLSDIKAIKTSYFDLLKIVNNIFNVVRFLESKETDPKTLVKDIVKF